jgi:hypothetical protein
VSTAEAAKLTTPDLMQPPQSAARRQRGRHRGRLVSKPAARQAPDPRRPYRRLRRHGPLTTDGQLDAARRSAPRTDRPHAMPAEHMVSLAGPTMVSVAAPSHPIRRLSGQGEAYGPNPASSPALTTADWMATLFAEVVGWSVALPDIVGQSSA